MRISFFAAVFAILSYDNNWAYRRKGGHSQHHCGYDRTLSLCVCIDLVSCRLGLMGALRGLRKWQFGSGSNGLNIMGNKGRLLCPWRWG